MIVSAVKESLQNDGKLGKFKAELRSAVMSILNKNNSNEEAPKIPTETKFMNDLIREYLSWNGYLYAEQMLSAGKRIFLKGNCHTALQFRRATFILEKSRTNLFPPLPFLCHLTLKIIVVKIKICKSFASSELTSILNNF